MCVYLFLPVNISLYIAYYYAMVLHQYLTVCILVLPVCLLQGEM